ncbi:MAG TPA: GNAT family N-acetyltransferase [Bacteroidales bacterium]|jgi:GNAT superfamily N-acetyltransferase|nr:GNAT family N-acetyltransferase [Bacteroidales bacterium]
MIRIETVTRANAKEAGFYCVQNKKSPGHLAKLKWITDDKNNGINIKIAFDEQGKQLGFIEYVNSENAWRPVRADNYCFIQCILVISKEARSKGVATALLNECMNEARQSGKNGVCVICSNGTWMADRTLFEKNGFTLTGRLERFDLLTLQFNSSSKLPAFIDWRLKLHQYQGWHLVYADQCPWHEKSVTDLQQAATDHGLKIHVHKLLTAAEAQLAPSGFGTFALINDGRLIEDHYISRSRFENILKKESGIK